MRNSIKREDGQVLVEFVLVIPILLLILFGILDLGNIAVSRYKVQTAAYETARFIEDYSGSDIDSDAALFIATAADSKNVIKGISPNNAPPGTAYYTMDNRAEYIKVTLTYHEECLTYITQLLKGSSFPITVDATVYKHTQEEGN